MRRALYWRVPYEAQFSLGCTLSQYTPDTGTLLELSFEGLRDLLLSTATKVIDHNSATMINKTKAYIV